MANYKKGGEDFQSTNYDGDTPTGELIVPEELRGAEPTQKPGGLLNRIAKTLTAGAESVQSGIHSAVARLTAPPTPPTSSRVVDLPWVNDDNLGFDDGDIEPPPRQMVVPQAAPAVNPTESPTGPGKMQRPTKRPTRVVQRPTSPPTQKGEEPQTGVTLPLNLNELGGASSGITGVLSTQYVGESRPAAPVQPEAKPEKPDFKKMILGDSEVQKELRILLDDKTFNDVLQRAGDNTLNDYTLYRILLLAKRGHHKPDVANSAFENLIKKLDLV